MGGTRPPTYITLILPNFKIQRLGNAISSVLQELLSRTSGSVVEHWAVTRDVVSSTLTGPTLRVLK